jgi:hypothetical protein
VVLAIEQTATATMKSQEKKQAAINMASEMLAHLHITASPTVLSTMIEATVYTLSQNKDAQASTIQPSPLAVAKIG